MLNTGRVKLMSQMALIERKNGSKIRRILNFSRRDYIGRALLLSFLSTTVFSAVVLACAALYLFLFALDEVLSDLLYFGVVALVLYAIFLYLRLTLAYRKASRQYREGYAALQKLRYEMEGLSGMYEDEAVQTEAASRTGSAGTTEESHE